MKYDVFISYSRKDFDEVSALLETIRKEIPDLSIWFDINGIESGDDFEDKIISAIDNSSYVMFALSDNSLASPWTKDEVMYARNTDKKVIPILLKDAQMKGWFLFKFGRVDCIDSTSRLQIDKLIHNLSSWTGKRISAHQSEPALDATLVLAMPSDQLCPCGSGKLFRDCHGKDLNSASKPVEKTWKVGDYYNVDGKEGVVFWVDETGRHGKIVSVKNIDDYGYGTWQSRCYKSSLTGGFYTTSAIGATDEYDGMKNQNVIAEKTGWRADFPVFAWCAKHGTGWYLPAIKELETLLLNPSVYDKVNDMIVAKGGDELTLSSSGYWSSTECNHAEARIINMYNRKSVATSKLGDFYVRAVSAF